MPFPDHLRRTGIRASRMSPAGPVSIIAVALIVFTVFPLTTTPFVAVITAPDGPRRRRLPARPGLPDRRAPRRLTDTATVGYR